MLSSVPWHPLSFFALPSAPLSPSLYSFHECLLSFCPEPNLSRYREYSYESGRQNFMELSMLLGNFSYVLHPLKCPI